MNTWLELLKNDDYIGIKKYIKNGANLEDANESGESVLACSLRTHCEMETIMLLVESGADIFNFDDEGVSIFDMAITYGNIGMLNYLLENGIDINATTRRSGFTPLMAAVCYGRVEIVKILITRGVNQKTQDTKGFAAVDFARKMNKKSILALLEVDENEAANRGYAR
ncbi:MAG: ankyrin repeat domain-containing protein [Sulfurimonas sp.]